MSNFKIILAVFTMIILHVVPVRAELQVIGTATAGYDDDNNGNDDYYNLVYDTEQQIVFLDYVRDFDEWLNQMNWASGLSLTVLMNPGFSTSTDLSTGWRLPTVENPQDTSIPSPPAPTTPILRLSTTADNCMYDGYRSEMACLYFSALGNEASPADYMQNNFDPFINLPETVINLSGRSFWTNSDIGTPGNTYKWDFNFRDGELFGGNTVVGGPDYVELYAIAVHEGIVSVQTDAKLFEDWNTLPALDADWGGNTGEDINVYITNGELHHVLRPYSATKSNIPVNARNRLINATTNDLREFETTVRIESIGNISQAPAIEYAAAEFFGFFYNTALSPTNATGDVHFRIRYGDRGNGLEVWWELVEWNDENFISSTEHAAGTIAAPLGGWQIGADYLVYIIYDGDNTFNLTFGGTSSGAIDGPARGDAPYTNSTWIRSRIFLAQPFTGNPDTNSLHAVFDDVKIGNSTTSLFDYDNFDGAREALAKSNWHKDEMIRQSTVTGNMLKMTLKSADDIIPGASNSIRSRTSLPGLYEKTDYFQADIMLEGGVIDDDTRGEIRAWGIWGNGKYNTENFPGGQDGKINFEINLQKRSNIPYAVQVDCFIGMCNDSNCTSPIDFSSVLDASATAAVDTWYTITMQRIGTVFSCQVDETGGPTLISESLDLSTHGVSGVAPVTEVAPIGEEKKFWVSVRDAPGEVVAYVDNVYIDGLSGDLNYDNAIDLKDMILGLKVVSGDNSTEISKFADSSGDGKVGMEEILDTFNQVLP